jgi:hypothetical protein
VSRSVTCTGRLAQILRLPCYRTILAASLAADTGPGAARMRWLDHENLFPPECAKSHEGQQELCGAAPVAGGDKKLVMIAFQPNGSSSPASGLGGFAKFSSAAGVKPNSCV